MSSAAPALPGLVADAPGVQLYEFQEQAVEQLRTNIRRARYEKRFASQVLSAPTGSGKTEVAMYLIQECISKGRRAVFAADQLALVGQTSRRLDRYGIPHGIIQGQNERRDDDAPVQLVSIQTIDRRKWPVADLYIIDECHMKRGPVIELIGNLRERKHDTRTTALIGLTATPFRRGMGLLYDTVVSVTTTERLIRQKFLASYRIFNANQPDMTGAKMSAGEWTDREAESRSLPIIGDIVAEYMKWCSGQRFIAFCSTISHCEKVQQRFMKAGINCALYTADTPDDAREQTLREFRDRGGNLMGLLSVSALAKGFDEPGVECIIFARPLRNSLAEHIQMWGRGLRVDPSNPSKICTILDFAGNVERFWPRTEHFFRFGAHELDDGTKKERKATERKEPAPQKCPKCFALHKPSRVCPTCGWEYPRAVRVRELPGELREWTGSGATAEPVDVLRSLAAQLAYVQQQQGRKHGWLHAKFRELSGGQTLPYVDTPQPPTEALLKRLKYLDIKWAKGQQKRRRR